MPNVYALITEYYGLVFLISNISFEKAPLRFFPCRTAMSHENDSPNLIKTSTGLLKDW